MATMAHDTGLRLSGSSLTSLLRRRAAARVLSVLIAILGWQLLAPLLPTDLIPTPLAVLEFMWNEIRGQTLARTTVYEAFWISLSRLFTGLGAAFLVGVPVGIAMGFWRPVDSFFSDFVVVGLAMPSLVWALLTGIWFGLGNAAPVITVFLAAMPFFMLNTAEGVRSVPKDLVEMGRAFDVSNRDRMRHVVLPSLMPFMFASLRYGLGNGWKGLVLAEVFAATNGAGWNIRYWYDAHRASGVFGYALFFVLFALLVERFAFQALSRRVFRWRGDDA